MIIRKLEKFISASIPTHKPQQRQVRWSPPPSTEGSPYEAKQAKRSKCVCIRMDGKGDPDSYREEGVWQQMTINNTK
ncbi:MAG: hypothetical protein B6D64_11875 [Bacteroidetes bacterium 4484_276]|nr:MAG: hypothetical protein B6D64_11875 [Bacteroidetes bacterium 4484_276]